MLFQHFLSLEPVAKKSARKSPLNCRLKSRLNRLFSRNNPLKRYFLLPWTPIPQDPGNRSGKRQSELVLRPEYLVYRVPGSPLTIRILVVSDILYGPPCECINSKEFSIGQEVICTQTEPELGESGNRGLENARIQGVMNLGSAMVWGGFLMGERGVGIEANGKRV
jgi:hypothetical protein